METALLLPPESGSYGKCLKLSEPRVLAGRQWMPRRHTGQESADGLSEIEIELEMSRNVWDGGSEGRESRSCKKMNLG